jgi:membrane-bound metal-dependent hydrolase YbcI (DUF457 family)
MIIINLACTTKFYFWKVIVFKGFVHLSFTVVALYALRDYVGVIIVIGAIIGTYLPDIDIRGSTASRIIPAYIFLQHRAQMHSVFMLALLSVTAAFISIQFAAGFFIGYGLHLAADGFTPMGLPCWDWIPGVRKTKKI